MIVPEWGDSLARIVAPLALVALLVWLSFRPRKTRCIADGPADEPYRIYTRDYDMVLSADQVVARLPGASPDGGRGHLDGAPAWERAVAEMEALLAERRAAFAAGRDEALARLREAAGAIDPRDVAVALLIDQSGSMKGSPIASAAVAATLLADLLTAFGACSEILGFSTAGWRGGHARPQWLEGGRPARPGRLCALMHVIYKSANEAGFGVEARKVMVHPDLLRENVDGEAILWARDRLAARPEPNKLLLVVSDGAPVDDSTLQSNGPSYLYRHVKSVLREAEADPQLTLGGVEINHDIEVFYGLAERAPTPSDVPDAAIRLLQRMLAERSARAASEVG